MADPPSRYSCDRCGQLLEGHDGLTAEDLHLIHRDECPERDQSEVS